MDKQIKVEACVGELRFEVTEVGAGLAYKYTFTSARVGDELQTLVAAAKAVLKAAKKEKGEEHEVRML